MAAFSDFSNILPNPTNKIGQAGQVDASGSAGLCFSAVKLISNDPMIVPGVGVGSASGFHQRWEIELSYNPMTKAQYNVISMFLLQKRTRLEPFFLSLPQYTGIVTDRTLDTTVIAGASQMLLDPDVASNPLEVSPGCLFYINTTTHTKAYMVTKIETSEHYLNGTTVPLSGETRIHFFPPLEAGVTAGATINFSEPLIRVQQMGDIGYSIDNRGLYNMNLKVEEVYP